VPGKFEMAVRLTRLLFPFILFVSLAAAVMGMLNARFVFGVPPRPRPSSTSSRSSPVWRSPLP